MGKRVLGDIDTAQHARHFLYSGTTLQLVYFHRDRVFFVAFLNQQVMLAANNERQFADLCRALGHAEWATDPRWAEPANRREHQDELRTEFERAFQARTAAEWEDLLDREGVPAARVRSIGELLREGQPAARDLLHELPVGANGTPVQVPAIGFRLNGDSLAPTRPPHRIGEDNARWLSAG